mmetsp:Transcript_81341/g.154386  ORF Transcript_81341/g.154386 Transcript_81341/m.154386 type:complete len:291 (-) Transcript_81341:200-1072(-)
MTCRLGCQAARQLLRCRTPAALRSTAPQIAGARDGALLQRAAFGSVSGAQRVTRQVKALSFREAGHSVVCVRSRSNLTWRERERLEDGELNTWWIATGLMGVFGAVWAFIPLYKMYCQATGQGQATAEVQKDYTAPPAPDSKAGKRLITVDFAGTVHDALPWEFVPQQKRMTVGLGETALAFYRAKNNSKRPIIGVSVYHMLPAEAGLYFNKIQCFCFDEQLINPEEEVDLPIFFFIDPLMLEDSRFDHIKEITLSYLFFESDSELPEEYADYLKASRSSQNPALLPAAV